MKLKLTIIGLVLILVLGSAFAQSDRASITGTVTDSTGAVVPGVQVTATNDGTQVKTSVKTNSLGIYNILNLPIGQYTLVFAKEGFSTYERKGVTLNISQVAGIDVSLNVGATSQVVMVTEDAPVLQTENAAVTTNLTNNVVSELPLSIRGGRTLSKFMFDYVPGVEGDDYSSHINGSVAKSKEVMIDGTSAVAQIGGYISESQPPMEAIEEFQVSTTGIRADEGHSGGGVFRYNMKSGTNKWHGSALGFLQNEALNANSWSNKYNGIKRSKDRLFDYGGSFGGPIRKDKTFFYAAYEHYQFQDFGPGGMGGVVPTTAFLNGDFSALLDHNTVLGTDGAGNTIYKGAIFDPATGNVFVNNIIPQNRISPVSQKIVDIYKAQYAPLVAGFNANNAMPWNQPAPWLQRNEFSVKIDHIINEKHRLSGSYILSIIPRTLADQGGIWAPGNTKDGGPLANSYDHRTVSPAIRVSEQWTISPSLLNVANFTLNRFYNPSKAMSQSGDWSKTLGLGNDFAGNFPIIKFQGINGDQFRCVPVPGGCQRFDISGIGSQFNDFYAANTFIYNDNLSWVHGRHVTKFGAEFRAMQFNSHGDQGVPQFVFDPAQTAGNYGGNAGYGFASFLLGQVNQASVSTPNNTYGRRKSFSAYAQDDYKVNSKLTLNADLRWDFNGRYHEKYGRWSNFNTTLINPATGKPGALEFAKNGSDSFERRQYWTNFSGHLGAAYALTPKTIVRASWGVFYVPLNLNTWGGIPYGFNPGFVQDNRVLTPFNWNNGYTGTAVDPVKDPNFTRWGMVSIDPRELELGNQQQWMVGVQRELSKDFRLDVNYIQSASYHLESGTLQGNQPDLATYSANVGNWWNGGMGLVPGYNGWGFQWANYTPFPTVAMTWGPLFYVGSPLGNADYKSLQFTLTKRTSHGLSMLASYNLSKAHGNVDDSFQELWWAGPIQDVYNLNKERHTISPYDQTHILKGYINYDLPFGKGKALLSNTSDILDKVVGGWTMSLGFHYNSGTPMRITANTWYPGINNVYANLDPKCSLAGNYSGHVGETYFNPTCITNPAYGQFGNAPGYFENLRNPGLKSEDLSVNKALAFGADGRYKLTLKAQFFNVFNRHSFGGPNTQIGSPDFGKVMSYSLNGPVGPRVGQIGARFTF